MNGDWDRDGARTRTGAEANEGTQCDNGDGSGGDNERSSGDGIGDNDRKTDRSEDGIGESGGEEKKRKKPHKSCRRDHALSFRIRHHLYRQGVALVDTGKLRSKGPESVYAHRTEGANEGARKMGAGTGAATGWKREWGREREQHEKRSVDGNEDGDGRRIMLRTGAQERETREIIGEGGEDAKKLQNSTRVVHMMPETRKSSAKIGKSVDKKVLVPKLPIQII